MLGYLYLKKNHFLCSERTLILSLESFCYSDKDGSCCPLGFVVGVFCFCSVMDMAATSAVASGFLTRPLKCSIRDSSVFVASRFFDNHYK